MIKKLQNAILRLATLAQSLGSQRNKLLERHRFVDWLAVVITLPRWPVDRLWVMRVRLISRAVDHCVGFSIDGQIVSEGSNGKALSQRCVLQERRKQALHLR